MNSQEAIDRRDFVKRAAFATGALLSTTMINRDVCAEEQQKDSPLFTFVQLNDTHMNVPNNPAYEKANRKFEYLVDVIPLVGDLVTPSTNIHGKPRYDHGFTDSNHKDPELYVSGNRQEQQFTVSLVGKVSIKYGCNCSKEFVRFSR